MSPPPLRRPVLATRSARGVRSQRGAALILVMLVLVVLLVLVFQVRYATIVELRYARTTLELLQRRLAADATRLHVESLLLQDLERAQESAGGGDAGVPGGDGGLDPFGAGGGDEGGVTGGEEDITTYTDSLLDEWMNPSALVPTILEGDLQVIAEVVDEDSKLNLLGLWTPDEEMRERYTEIVVRLLDEVFEGTSYDYSHGDALDVVKELDDWVKGFRTRGRDPIPRPRLKVDRALQDEELEIDSEFDEDEHSLPLTLGELLFLEKVTPEHLWGFHEDGEFHAGLERYLTVWSHCEILPAEVDEDDDLSQSPFGTLDDAEQAEQEQQSIEEAIDVFGNNGLVNINLAPLAVLRALAPEAISTSTLEKILEYRERALEELEEEQEQLGNNDLLDDQIETDEAEEFGDSVEDYVFSDPADLFVNLEQEFNISINAHEDEQQEMLDFLTTTSDVFTIKLGVYNQELAGTSVADVVPAFYRTVVWRISSGEEIRIITLLPLEPYPDPRRLGDWDDETFRAYQDAFELPADVRREESRRDQ